MLPYLPGEFGNPSSPHVRPRARAALDVAHERIAAQINAGPREVILTSGGTEALNLALKGAAWAGKGRGHRIVTSAVEHHAVLHSLQQLEKFGFEIVELPVDRYGRVDPDHVAAALNERTMLVSIQLANNEVGTLQPIEAIGKVVREGPKDCLFVVDAVRPRPGCRSTSRRSIATCSRSRGTSSTARRGRRAVPAPRHAHPRPAAGRDAGAVPPRRHGGRGGRRGHERCLRARRAPSARRPSSASGKLRDRLRGAMLAEDGVELTGHPRDRLPNLLSVVVGDAEGALDRRQARPGGNRGVGRVGVHDGLDRPIARPDRAWATRTKRRAARCECRSGGRRPIRRSMIDGSAGGRGLSRRGGRARGGPARPASGWRDGRSERA